MERLPELRIISRYGVGVDTVDLDAAREMGIWVANVPDYGAEEVAAHAFAMVLALVRHLPAFDRAVRAGDWQHAATGEIHRLGQLTLGVVGVGRIGSILSERARPWFARVLGHDPVLAVDRWPPMVERVDLETLFGQSHVVSLHAPLTGDTHNIVDGRLLSVMQRGAYLVNTARGGLVDLDALRSALDTGRLAGAALDVLPLEPPPLDHPIRSHPKVLLSPHAAFYSVESVAELRRKTAENVVQWLRDGRPRYVVVEGRTD